MFILNEDGGIHSSERGWVTAVTAAHPNSLTGLNPHLLVTASPLLSLAHSHPGESFPLPPSLFKVCLLSTAHLQVKNQLSGVGSLQPCGFRGSN